MKFPYGMADFQARFLARGTASGELLAETLQSGTPIEVGHVEDRFRFSDVALRGPRTQVSLASFLYYFGMLTIAGSTPWRTARLAPPNLVVQKLYVEEMLRWVLEGETGHRDLLAPARRLMIGGEIERLLSLNESKLLPRFSARNRRWMNELALARPASSISSSNSSTSSPKLWARTRRVSRSSGEPSWPGSPRCAPRSPPTSRPGATAPDSSSASARLCACARGRSSPSASGAWWHEKFGAKAPNG